jgi:hypothetical protein
MDKNGLIQNMKQTANLKPRKIVVEGWGEMYVKALTVADVQADQEKGDVQDKRTLAIGAARIICDENGALIFDRANEEDIKLLQSQPWNLLSKVITASGDYNGTTEAGQKEAKKG